jgi:hypothetical protein
MEPPPTVPRRLSRYRGRRVVTTRVANMDEAWGTVLTYAAAAWALFTTHSGTLMTVGGLILLGARLVVEVPKAVNAIKGLRKPKE